MKRTLIRHRPRRNRTLKTEDWAKLNARVEDLDRDAVIEFAEKAGWVPIFLKPGKPPMVTRDVAMEICPAVVMDPSELGNCWGAWRRDHVKDDPMIGQKATDDERHLVSLCAGHDERGARAGFQWNTANRDKERAYLRSYRPARGAGDGGEDVS